MSALQKLGLPETTIIYHMEDKKLIGAKIYGWLYIIFSLPLLGMGGFAIYEAFTSDCGLGMFFSFWVGLPLFLIGFYGLRIGIAFLKQRFRRLFIMIFLVGAIFACTGYLFYLGNESAVMLFMIIYLSIFFIAPLIYLVLHRERGTLLI